MDKGKRSVRLAQQIHRDISNLLRIDLAENLPGMLTFTHVRLSDDLKYATVFYSFLGSESDRDFAHGYLERERKRIRKLIGSGLRLRSIPEFRFVFDPSIEEGIKIERLLNEIKNDRDE